MEALSGNRSRQVYRSRARSCRFSRIPYTRRTVRRANFAQLLVLALVVAGGGAHAQAEDPDLERKLGALRARIATIEREQRQAAEQRDQESRALREAEQAVARESRALADTRRERSEAALRREELAARRAVMAAGLEADSEALAAELRAAWIAGGEPQLKIMLSQRDPAELGRMLTWYGYVARQRAGRVEDLRLRLARLAELSREVDAESARLAAAETRLAVAVGRLEGARAERAAAVRGFDADLARQGREAQRLKAEAAALEQLVAQLRAAVVELPVPDSAPFIQQRGRLAWPVGGVLARAFGERRGEGLQSNGVLISAERGAEVRAVWHGRVAYSDWLPGLGLLLVLEHGDGYMSLYGHNEVLFSGVGDWVAAGEVLGQVGDSGGRDQAGLYFEIRSGTKPQNPAAWFRSRTPGQ
jgi:murein hydrolase activator